MKSIPIPAEPSRKFIVRFNGEDYHIEADVVSEDTQDNRMRFYKNNEVIDIIDWKLNPPVASFPLDKSALVWIPRDNYTSTNIDL